MEISKFQCPAKRIQVIPEGDKLGTGEITEEVGLGTCDTGCLNFNSCSLKLLVANLEEKFFNPYVSP